MNHKCSNRILLPHIVSILLFITGVCASSVNSQVQNSEELYLRSSSQSTKSLNLNDPTAYESLEEIPMPAHQRFLQERHNDMNKSPPLTDIQRRMNKNNHRQHHTMNQQMSFEKLIRELDVLSANWWVRLGESERRPESRRAHSATVYALYNDGSDPESDSTNNEGTNVNPVSPGPNGPDIDPANTQQKQDSSQPDRNINTDSGDISNNTSTASNEHSIETTVNSTSNFTVTTSPPNRMRKLNKKSKPYQEYMVISGGFTDKDWKTFPVWAYDMTSATSRDEGHWYELTPPAATTSDTSLCDSNTTDIGITHAKACSPESRLGHMSVVRDGSLYVFGGLNYDEHDGVFLMEKEPFMYRMKLEESEFQGRDYENYEGNFDADVSTKKDDMYWERWLPNIKANEHNAESKFEDLKFALNRGEVRGGYWKSEDKLVVYGGLHVREYRTSTGREQQGDTTLGDVWAYDFKSDTWEMMAASADGDNLYHPGGRTSHAATLVDDELVVYGGLREIETYLWDGSTVWSQLDDIWVFNLKSKTWTHRPMAESIGRAYHSVVGWKLDNREGTILASFGGYKMMIDPVDNQEVSYVYDDTMISMPQVQNTSQPSVWYVASYNGLQPETVSIRLEHTAVLSEQFGNMFVWGGRYRQTSDISGVWSLNIAGETSKVEYLVRSEDGPIADAGAAYVILLTVMMMSMMFTYACGVAQRRQEIEAMNADALNADPTLGGSVFGRNGLGQDIIDTLPLKKYETEGVPSENTENQPKQRTTSSTEENDSAAMNFNFEEDDDEICCPICLVEYEVGDEIRCLPCNHEFHKSCVDPWMQTNASCPACRYSLSDLASLTTSAESFSQAIRATISASLFPSSQQNTNSSTATNTNTTSTDEQQTNPSLTIPRSSSMSPPPGSPTEDAIAPGARTFANIRRLLNRRRRQNLTRVQSNDSISSRSNDGNADERNDGDNDSFGDLELSYNSSLELSESYESPTSGDSFDSGDIPLEGRPRQMRLSADERRRNRRSRRRAGRRMRRVRGLNGSPLNAPLQPSDNGALV